MAEMTRAIQQAFTRGAIVKAKDATAPQLMVAVCAKEYCIDGASPRSGYAVTVLVKRWVDGQWLDGQYDPDELEVVLPSLPPPPSVFANGETVRLKSDSSGTGPMVVSGIKDDNYRCVWRVGGIPHESIYAGEALVRNT